MCLCITVTIGLLSGWRRSSSSQDVWRCEQWHGRSLPVGGNQGQIANTTDPLITVSTSMNTSHCAATEGVISYVMLYFFNSQLGIICVRLGQYLSSASSLSMCQSFSLSPLLSASSASVSVSSSAETYSKIHSVTSSPMLVLKCEVKKRCPTVLDMCRYSDLKVSRTTEISDQIIGRNVSAKWRNTRPLGSKLCSSLFCTF